MKCQKCNEHMVNFQHDAVQGCVCPKCGWNIVTTRISEINMDGTEYSIHIRATVDINKEKIKLIARIAGVNYVCARQILIKDSVCILKAKAPEVKQARDELEKLNIKYEIIPVFKY